MNSRPIAAAEADPFSFPRRWFDRQVVPAAIDGAAAIEAILQKLAERAERQPMPLICMALASGAALALCLPRRGSR